MVSKALCCLKPGEKGTISEIRGGAGAGKRLLDMGVVTGTQLEVVRVAPLGDPIEIRIKGYNLALRKAEAEGVTVEVE